MSVMPTITVDGVEAQFSVSVPLPIPDGKGWYRSWASVPGKIAIQIFNHQDGNILVDVFNTSSSPQLIVVGTIQRMVPPNCGVGWTKNPPRAKASSDLGKWDEYWRALELSYGGLADYGYTLNTGSPRNVFFSAQNRRAHESPSRAMESYLDRFVEFQLRRPYNNCSEKGAAFPLLVGEPLKASGWVYYDDVPVPVTPMDTFHFENSILWLAYKSTGSPRALDQLIRLTLWSDATQDYYKLDGVNVYGGIARCAGWWNIGLMRAAQASLDSGIYSLYNHFMTRLNDHIDYQLSLPWSPEGLSPFVATPLGSHLLVPHCLPWMDAVWGFSLFLVAKKLGMKKALPLAEKINDYLNASGWDGKSKLYDSIPAKKEDAHVLPKPAGLPGIGYWFAPSLVMDKRSSPLKDFLINFAKSDKQKFPPVNDVQLVFSPESSGGVNYFDPSIFLDDLLL